MIFFPIINCEINKAMIYLMNTIFFWGEVGPLIQAMIYLMNKINKAMISRSWPTNTSNTIIEIFKKPRYNLISPYVQRYYKVR